jgi:hypothetical protein
MTKKSSDYGWNQPIDPIWERHEYDGIMGFPPEWVSEPRMKEFCLERGCLFFEVEQEKVTYDELKSRFDWMLIDMDAAMSLVLFKDARTEYDDSLSLLLWLFKAVSLGEIEGLRLLSGNLAVMGKRKSISTSVNARKPRPKKNFEGETLDYLIAKLKLNNPNLKPSELWVHLKNEVDQWSDGDCEESGENDSRRYTFKIEGVSDSITFGTFRKKLLK